jgi:predicted dehydrogenase/GNAT superfamily N-acetyltransferase
MRRAAILGCVTGAGQLRPNVADPSAMPTFAAPVRVGVVGAVGRGASYARALAHTGFFTCHAVCDAAEAKLAAVRAAVGAPEAYSSYEDMLARSDLQAVIIATPMHLHAPMAIAALDRGLEVFSEVTAGVTIDECRALTLAAHRSRAGYLMAENYLFLRENLLVKEIVARGLFGETYYAEAEYLHNIKGLLEATPWRLRWQTGVDGNTYCTHSLGPVLQWMPGARLTEVSCAGAGHHHRDARGEPFIQQSTTITLGRTSRGGLVKLRLDLLSDRPTASTNYALQGTDGAYESARSARESHRIWLRCRHPSPEHWEDLRALEPEFASALESEVDPSSPAGHGGSDWRILLYWRDVLLGRRPNELGIHQAMDLTLPGLVSQQSILQRGAWLPVPDSRDWVRPAPRPPAQLVMLWPAGRPPPSVRLPAGYTLDTFRENDADSLVALMRRVGFTDWSLNTLEGVRRTVLPGGLFVVRHGPDGAVVATANANHPPVPRYLEAGELGWVAADPAHAGRGLGRAVCAAVVARFQAAGFCTIYLSTDDHRLPAIKVYLDLGFVPDLYRDDMAERWAAIRARLGCG